MIKSQELMLDGLDPFMTGGLVNLLSRQKAVSGVSCFVVFHRQLGTIIWSAMVQWSLLVTPCQLMTAARNNLVLMSSKTRQDFCCFGEYFLADIDRRKMVQSILLIMKALFFFQSAFWTVPFQTARPWLLSTSGITSPIGRGRPHFVACRCPKPKRMRPHHPDAASWGSLLCANGL